MKLKNIIMALGVAVAFSACSNDSDVAKEKEKETVYLSIRVATNARTGKTITSKAYDPNALVGEQNINTLAAFVFNAVTQEAVGGMMVAANASEVYQMNDIPAATGADPAMIVLVSNAPAATMEGITNYGQLQGALAQLGDQQQTNLTMSTQLITTEFPLDNGYNYIGFGSEQTNVNDITAPLWLTRLPARLQVTGASTNFTREELLGRTVTINSISFANVKTDSHFFSEADWGEVQSDGGGGTSGAIVPDGVVIDNDNPRTDLNYITYVMENLGEGTAPTSIVVSATLSATDEYLAETVSFTAPVNAVFRTYESTDGLDVSHQYVKRNFIYNISMSFGDAAFDGTITDDVPPPPPPVEPDPTVFSVAVSVVGWGVVEQPVPVV